MWQSQARRSRTPSAHVPEVKSRVLPSKLVLSRKFRAGDWFCERDGIFNCTVLLTLIQAESLLRLPTLCRLTGDRH